MHTFVQQLLIGLSIGATYALIALGYTMVYGVLRLINFAHGDVYMVGAVVGYHIANLLVGKAPPWVVLMAAFGGYFAAASLCLSLVLMTALTWLVMKTRTGLALRALSFRFETARLMGIN